MFTHKLESAPCM